jgi:hypothetical protein
MRVRVKLFAALRHYVPDARYGIPLEVELFDGATLTDLFTCLKLPHQEVKVAFVNGRAQPEGGHFPTCWRRIEWQRLL